MKPVPISQYLDHIGRVAQGDRQTPRREISPFRPRAVGAVPDSEPHGQLAFSRVLREAAIAARSRALEDGQDRSGADGRIWSRDGAPSRSRETAPGPDVEARVAEAYDRGLREGAAAARAEDAESQAREQASRQQRELAERLDFQMNEYNRLADAIAAGLDEIEQRIAAAVARILAPLLASELSKQVVDELCVHVAQLCAGGSPGLIRIRGPERLLAALRDRVASLAVDVEFVAEDGVEATIEAQHTMISSQLQPWADLIDSLVV
ncbi:MAG: hypothetical protein ABR863_13870 [Roseiarcus sp.]|jgi:hypothetical protein